MPKKYAINIDESFNPLVNFRVNWCENIIDELFAKITKSLKINMHLNYQWKNPQVILVFIFFHMVTFRWKNPLVMPFFWI